MTQVVTAGGDLPDPGHDRKSRVDCVSWRSDMISAWMVAAPRSSSVEVADALRNPCDIAFKAAPGWQHRPSAR